MKRRPSLFTVSSVIIAAAFALALLIFMLSALGILPPDGAGQKAAVQYEEIGLFVALLALATSISLALPKFISKQQISTVVNDYMEHRYKADLAESIENVSCTDANLSRMIAFLLMEQKYYYWAIGWGFRALKNYKALTDDHQDLYQEFHELVLRDVVLPSVRHRAEDRGTQGGGSTLSQKELERIKIRAVKDYVDFAYEVEKKDRCEAFSKYLRNNLSNELKEIHGGMLAVCADLLNDYYATKPPKKNAVEYTLPKRRFKKDIMRISKYRNDGNDFAKFFDTTILSEVNANEEDD